MKLQGLFITPVFTTKLENNYDIEKKLYELKNKDSKGKVKSNLGGWHSHEELYKEEEFKKITGDILYGAQQCFTALNVEDKYSPEMTGFWGMINQPGARNMIHTHPLNYLSGVYYVKVPKKSGNIVFLDPRPQSQVLDAPQNTKDLPLHLSHSVQLEPKDNDLIFFPSWLQHEVQTNNSNEDRIILSFNIRWTE